jgi:uronate dehydrogenase
MSHLQTRAVQILITGAAGTIGTSLRPPLRERAALLRLVDTEAIGDLAGNEEAVRVDLTDLESAVRAASGTDAVVHLAAIPVEDSFDRLLEANFRATYNVFEAARQTGVRRVVFASSNHATGFYGRDERISPRDPPRPDSLYGVSKVFGEALGSLYADKFGLEVVVLRIGAFGPAPERHGPMLPMWISPGDMSRLVWAALTAPDVRFEIVYGLSRTGSRWWDNAEAARRIGYAPEDEVEMAPPERAEWRFQGFPFTEPDRHG